MPAPTPVEFDTANLALAVVEAAWDIKARNVRVLDVRGMLPYADFLIICEGTSDRHAEAIAEHVMEDLRPYKVRPLGIEGLKASAGRRERAAWILVDFADAVLHVFGSRAMRQEYNIESMYADAPRMQLTPPSDLEDSSPSGS
jgi:ribosome-associated protein